MKDLHEYMQMDTSYMHGCSYMISETFIMYLWLVPMNANFQLVINLVLYLSLLIEFFLFMFYKWKVPRNASMLIYSQLHDFLIYGTYQLPLSLFIHELYYLIFKHFYVWSIWFVDDTILYDKNIFIYLVSNWWSVFWWFCYF